MLSIFFSEDSDLIETEVEMKGWRGDVLVKTNGNFYSLDFLTIERLHSEYLFAKNKGEIYVVDDVTVIVESVRKNDIVNAIKKLGEEFFMCQNTINLKEKYQYAFQKLQKIENWITIYSEE